MKSVRVLNEHFSNFIESKMQQERITLFFFNIGIICVRVHLFMVFFVGFNTILKLKNLEN